MISKFFRDIKKKTKATVRSVSVNKLIDINTPLKVFTLLCVLRGAYHFRLYNLYAI